MSYRKRVLLITSLALACATAGFVSGRGTASGAAESLQLAKSIESGVGIFASPGETPEQMSQENNLHVQAYEPEDKEGGGGAEQKTLIDNDKVKVILVSYKKGFQRGGGVKRRYDTALVYVDPGRYTITAEGANTPVHMAPHKLAPGSVVFHRKDSIVSALTVDEDYRVLYVEMK